MPEALDWKQKYRDSLIEAEAEEKRWRQIEQALRRLIGRLCAAGMGVDPQLDDELIALAAANRRNADALELERLAASLTTVVVAVDAVSPVPTVKLKAPDFKRWDVSCAALAALLQRLKSADIDSEACQRLSAELALVTTDAELTRVVEGIADLIDLYSEALSRERLQSASVLEAVTKRLEEMGGYLTEVGDADRSRFADSASVNDTVMLQVQELSAEVRSATELNSLQLLVSSRLQTVTQQVLDFRTRETARLQEHSGRAERMRARIADLERETQELHSKLDREKHGARLDPLTRLANRKSFDERIALEILRHSQSDSPLAILLWDLDNFKGINDTYGHRAGDRVLQAVAAGFMSMLRVEDFVARIGGEEFLVLMPDTTPDHALRTANEMRASIESLRFHFRGTPVHVTVSCGVTELRSGDSSGAAFDRADAALYRAKHGGKNLCVMA